MKKYIKYVGLVLVGVLAFSCNKKDDFNYKTGYVGISKITTYPIITVAGDPYIYVAKGGTYTDPGATAKAGTADVKVVATGLPDVNTAGVYTETYTATNTDGFAATGTRTIAVYSTDATAAANDYSGSYARSTNGSLAVWTKVAPGVYSVFNPGGAPGTNLTVIVFNPTGSKIFIPAQIAGGNATSSSTESTVTGPGGTLASYMMVIINPGYGGSLRSFAKQ
ncbi:MAG: hypothetical protein JWR50_2579 [Mucilaginibacter sp.]|nr:hypothetical protein [Mucilaginibacter sp.]